MSEFIFAIGIFLYPYIIIRILSLTSEENLKRRIYTSAKENAYETYSALNKDSFLKKLNRVLYIGISVSVLGTFLLLYSNLEYRTSLDMLTPTNTSPEINWGYPTIT